VCVCRTIIYPALLRRTGPLADDFREYFRCFKSNECPGCYGSAGRQIIWLIDGGQVPGGVPSTVVALHAPGLAHPAPGKHYRSAHPFLPCPAVENSISNKNPPIHIRSEDFLNTQKLITSRQTSPPGHPAGTSTRIRLPAHGVAGLGIWLALPRGLPWAEA